MSMSMGRAAHLEGQDDDSHIEEHGGLHNARKDIVLILYLPGVELVEDLHSTAYSRQPLDHAVRERMDPDCLLVVLA